jgi:hypothetical protein
MMRRLWPLFALVLVGFAVGFVVAVRRTPPGSSRLPEMRARHQRLHAELESLLRAEPLVADPVIDGPDVVVAIRTGYLSGLIREVARRYLERVELDLSPHIQVRQGGDVSKKTPFGTMTFGQWKVDVDIAHLAGVLGAEASPELDVAGDNRVRLMIPVRVSSAQGQGVARFEWDSKSVANVLCKDFAVEEQLDAIALPAHYRVRGGFLFSQLQNELVAQPEFPAEKFHIRVDLTPESWAKVQRALENQDTWEKCALGVDPPEILAKLREIAQRGFDFKLPRSLFRPIVMPAFFRSRVSTDAGEVDVAVDPRALRLTADHLYYAADLRVKLMPAPAASATPPIARPEKP